MAIGIPEFATQLADLQAQFVAGDIDQAELAAGLQALWEESENIPLLFQNMQQVIDVKAAILTAWQAALNVKGQVASVSALPSVAAERDAYQLVNPADPLDGHLFTRVAGVWTDIGPLGGERGASAFEVAKKVAEDAGETPPANEAAFVQELRQPALDAAAAADEVREATDQARLDALDAKEATEAVTEAANNKIAETEDVRAATDQVRLDTLDARAEALAAAAAANLARDAATFKAVYATRAELFADLAYGPKTFGVVYDDATTAYNGSYIKTGASGGGAWAKADSTGGLIFQTLPIESGYIMGLVDSAGRAAWLIRTDGTFMPTKIQFPGGSVTADALSALSVSLSKLAPEVTNILDLSPTPLPLETGFLWALIDRNKRYAMAVKPDGSVVIPKLTLGAGSIARTVLDASLQQMIPAQLNIESGYLFAIIDAAKRIGLAIRRDGTVKGYIDRAKVADNVYSSSGPRANASYIVLPFKDGSGNWQLKSQRRSDGQLFVLTSIGNNVDPDITPDNQVIFWTDQGGGALMSISAEGGTAQRIEPEAAIACWGDSMTYGVGENTAANRYPQKLATLTGRTVFNGGLGGQWANEITARQGGFQSLLTVTGNQIPASGGVQVTAQSIQLLNGQSPLSITGTLAGVPGTLSWASGPVFTFTRTTAGSVVACPAGTPFIPDLAGSNANRIQLLWYGRNNRDGSGNLTTAIYADVKAALDASIAYLKPFAKRFVVMGIINGADEPSGSARHTAITGVNAMLQAAFGGAYLDARSPPTTEEMATIGFTPTSDDLTDIAADCIPRNMRANVSTDLLHGNSYLYALEALRAQRFIQAKGW